MTQPPVIAGYLFDRLVHAGQDAEVWLGRSARGQEVSVTILTEAGAADPATRQGLADAAQNSLLWAANFAAERPYVIVRVNPAATSSVALSGSRLAASVVPADPGVEEEPRTDAVGGGLTARLRSNSRVVAWVLVAVLICAAYLAGGVVNKAVARSTSGSGQGELPTPSPLPPDTLLPGVVKVPEATMRPGLRPVSVVGPTFAAAEKASPVIDLGLPFAFRWPAGSAGTIGLGETSYALFRRVIAGTNANTAPIDLRIAAHPCQDLEGCLAERSVFDNTWTRRFPAKVPATTRDGQTWFTQSITRDGDYELTLTRAFTSRNQWWLVGAVITASPEHRTDAQKVINDLRTQTS